jgi:hypothetical protein
MIEGVTMKKLLIISSLLPLFSFAASQPLPAITDIKCAANYGDKGVYLVQSNEKTSQLAIVQQGKIVNSQQFDAAAYTCSLHPEHPVGYIGITGQPQRLLQNFNYSYAFPTDATAINLDPDANMAEYWLPITDDAENFNVTITELSTGKIIAQHTIPKDSLNHKYLDFSADGKNMLLLNMDGSRGLRVLEPKTLNWKERIEYKGKNATTTKYIGNHILTNFSGTVQLYQGDNLLWSYQHPEISGEELQVSRNQKLLLLGNGGGNTFAILNTAGEALLEVTFRQTLPDSEHYRLLQLLDDGFVMKHTDDQHYRVYNLEQQVLRTFKLDSADTLLPPPSVHQDFYRLSPTKTPTGLRRQTLTLLQ